MPRRICADFQDGAHVNSYLLGCGLAVLSRELVMHSEQASHDEGLVKGSHHVTSQRLQCFGIQGPSPFARHGPFPSTVNLTCGRRS